jgi:hypothetical protein
VYNVILAQVDQSIIHIFDDGIGLCLVKYLFEFESILEIALVTQFCNDVAVAIGSEDFETFKHAGMVEFFEDFDFLEKELLKFFGLERIQFDDLDSDDFVWKL